MNFQNRARKVLSWTSALLLAAAAGAVWLAYSYATDSSTLTALIEAEAPRYLPGARLRVHEIKVRPLLGEVSLKLVTLWQDLDGMDHLALRIPWLLIRHDTAAMLDGKLHPRDVVVSQPELQLRRRRDGTWNLQGLLADPWPAAPPPVWPRVMIRNGTVKLVDEGQASSAILREVKLLIEPTPEGPLRFEGEAKGDVFEDVRLRGTIDCKTGRVTLADGDLARLTVSDTLRRRLPPEVRPALERAGLSGGVIDLALQSLIYEPGATPEVRYAGSARLRDGTLKCDRLPFELAGVSASVSARDGRLTVDWAEGRNGKTTVRVRRGGTIDLADPERGPMALTLDVTELEFDDRLRAWTPPPFAPLWREFEPVGWINLALSARRDRPGGPVGFGLAVECLDVGMRYAHFRYPLEHIRGTLKWEGERIKVDVRTLIGLKPARAVGTIDHPGDEAGDRAIVELDFAAEALPVDRTLLDAMPPDVRQVVEQFQPTGSVRGTAHLRREPPGPGDPVQGKIRIDSVLDLNEGCSIRWVDMPYSISKLTGRLELHPDRWLFRDMHGINGVASITGEGEVWKVGPGADDLKTDLRLRSQRLPCDDQLLEALPPAWKQTWATLNPSGSIAVAAHIRTEPGKEHHHLEIVPERDARIVLKLPRIPGPGVAPGDQIVMPPMEDIKGNFVYDDGTVRMTDVSFRFRESPAHFERGQVTLEDIPGSVQFDLGVKGLEVADFRLDNELRKIMPPVMAQFARRLDDGKPFQFRTDMRIGWSGQPDQPAWCSWRDALIVFNGNTIQTGLPLEHLQGQIDNLWGSYNGRDLVVHGAVNLASIGLLGQQLTQVTSPLHVEQNRASLTDIRGILLGGELTGKVEVELEATPKYLAALAVKAADLRRYTKTLDGRQDFRGLVDAQVVLGGQGQEMRTLQGHGQADVTQADLGELPFLIRLMKLPMFAKMTKTAFDEAHAVFQIRNGETHFNPIKLTGDAISLEGPGTLSAQGELDLALRILYGRDEGRRIPIVSDALREAGGQIFLIRVTGHPAFPKIAAVPLRQASDVLRSFGARRGGRGPVDDRPTREGRQ